MYCLIEFFSFPAHASGDVSDQLFHLYLEKGITCMNQSFLKKQRQFNNLGHGIWYTK